MKKRIKVGSRDSVLAVAQTRLILEEIQRKNPEIEFELITMKTTGDKILDRNLDQIGGKGLFVKELDQALFDGRIDMSVHSLKDLPMDISKDIPLIGFSKREDPRDVMIYQEGMQEFTEGCIGTSSRRRMEQLKKLYPKATFRGIRGNVQTRLRKLNEEDYNATILAKAGLSRLGMQNCIGRIFSTEELIPAAGQGILAIQGRKGEDYSFLDCIKNRESEYAALAERSFVRRLDGGCSSPIAAYAEVSGQELRLKGLYYDEEKQDYIVGDSIGSVEQAEAIGAALADHLKKKMEGSE